MLVIGYSGQRLFAQVIRVPLRLIIPAVLLLCCVGAYMETGSVFSIYVMLFFALLGFFARKLDFSFVTFLIGFVVGPSLELTFRQSIQILDHDAVNLASHPIAIIFILLTFATVWWTTRSNSRTAASQRRANHDLTGPTETETKHIQKGG
jgi:putative tricarboxylic transport membrane protein